MGFVFRNDRGEVVLCGVEEVSHTQSPLHAELRGAWFGLHMTKIYGLYNIALENDSAVAISELHNGPSFSEWGCLIADILILARSCNMSSF